MSYEKLKVRGKEHNDFYAIVDVGGNGAIFYEEVQTLERAERFVKCWNGWDELTQQRNDLLAACRFALSRFGGKLSKNERELFPLTAKEYDMLEEAIAKCEKQGTKPPK